MKTNTNIYFAQPTVIDDIIKYPKKKNDIMSIEELNLKFSSTSNEDRYFLGFNMKIMNQNEQQKPN
jgi:hypothetical protein